MPVKSEERYLNLDNANGNKKNNSFKIRPDFMKALKRPDFCQHVEVLGL